MQNYAKYAKMLSFKGGALMLALWIYDAYGTNK